jgi:phosphatidylserine/phosphatidylglycerophosphate/cardiolipin synthase-like enzyme
MFRMIITTLLFFVFPVLAAPSVSVGFSPSHTALQTVLSVINDAKTSLDVEAYSFTSRPIARAIIEAQKRGVRVRVVADDKANADRYSAITYLANNHVPVRLNRRYAIMHNKVMISDGDTVQTGSFNYTASADSRNAENSLVLRGVPKIAAQYQKEFNRLWEESDVLAPAY